MEGKREIERGQKERHRQTTGVHNISYRRNPNDMHRPFPSNLNMICFSLFLFLSELCACDHTQQRQVTETTYYQRNGIYCALYALCIRNQQFSFGSDLSRDAKYAARSK